MTEQIMLLNDNIVHYCFNNVVQHWWSNNGCSRLFKLPVFMFMLPFNKCSQGAAQHFSRLFTTCNRLCVFISGFYMYRSFATTSQKLRSWLIPKTKMASTLWPIEFLAYEKLDGPENERYKKVSMCGFDPYETQEHTKHTNQINQDGARWLGLTSCANDLQSGKLLYFSYCSLWRRINWMGNSIMLPNLLKKIKPSTCTTKCLTLRY